VAKPRDRWRVRKHVKLLSGIRRWKASRAGKAHRVDARWVESVLAPHRHEAIELHGPGGARQGASEAAFGDRARGRKRRGTKAPHLRIRFEVPGDAFLPHGRQHVATAHERAEAGTASSKRGSARGPDCRKVVRHRSAARGGNSESNAGWSDGLLSGSSSTREPSEADGCTCRKSVAEVGEKYLPRHVEVSREASREVVR